MSAPNWTAPYWSKPPQQSNEWNLLEIKQGSLLFTYSLNELASNRSGCISFGRMDDSSFVDIVTAHESCSRLHARLAFDASGNLWLRDLKSNNGTFVNDARLPPEACGKVEAMKGSKEDGTRGSRGVMVYPGDVLKFGASTRIYCVEGPEEFDRDARRKQADSNIVPKSMDANSGDNDENQQTVPELECSWGMAVDEEPLQDEHETARNVDPNLPSLEAFFSPSSNYTIPSSLQQLYKTYQMKQFKLQAIQTETGRIVQKEDRGVELTDGQTRQVEKNRERMDTLEKDLDHLTIKIEEGIYGVIHGVQINLKKRSNAQSTNKDDDADDFYDRTAQNEKKQRTNNDKAESEQSLIQKWESLYNSHKKQLVAISSAESKNVRIKREISEMEDDEEAFFLQNDLTLAKEELAKLKSAFENIEKEWSDTEYLLKIVNPKLTWRREDGWIGVQSEERATGEGIYSHNETTDAVKTEESIMMPPPSKIIAESSESSFRESTENQAAPYSLPISCENSTSVNPTMPPPLNVTPQARPINNKPKAATNKRHIGPARPSSTIGTLAALQQAATVELKDNHMNLSQTHTQVHNPTVQAYDPRKDEWSAPKDQDGSGRTALHDKFKGKY